MASSNGAVENSVLLIVSTRDQGRAQLSQCFVDAGYRAPLMASNSQEAEVLLAQSAVSAVVLDLTDEPVTEIDAFQQLLERGMLPFMVVADSGFERKLQTLKAGVHDYLERPFQNEELVRRVAGLVDMNHLYQQSCLENQLLRQMVHEQMKQLQAARVAMLQSAAGGDLGVESLLKGLRMSQSCYIVARALNLDDEVCEQIRLASPMQDIGSIAIPDRILQKNGRLSFEEREIIKMHVLAGDEILGAQGGEISTMARQIARHHHERWDGNGYPEGLSGDEIPLVARIAAVCDVFDALTTERPHKAAWSVDDAIEEIRNRSGSHFDPSLVPIFIGAIPDIIASRR